MEKSIFTDKKVMPDETDLMNSLNATYDLWQHLREYVFLKYPGAVAEWNYPGEKYGWSFRIKDKKRAIIYLLPREDYFQVAFVFGQKATDAVVQSNVSHAIKSELSAAKPYAEGRGIRLDIKDDTIVNDIKELVDIKIAY